VNPAQRAPQRAFLGKGDGESSRKAGLGAAEKIRWAPSTSGGKEEKNHSFSTRAKEKKREKHGWCPEKERVFDEKKRLIEKSLDHRLKVQERIRQGGEHIAPAP